jgi:hypothetical protein
MLNKTRPYTSYDMEDLNIQTSQLKLYLHFLYHTLALCTTHLIFLDLVVIITYVSFLLRDFLRPPVTSFLTQVWIYPQEPWTHFLNALPRAW